MASPFNPSSIWPPEEEPTMKRWQCSFCSHIYDERLGDPDNGIPPGTPLEDLPDDWMCPDCGAGKADYFEIV
jgi:rubredoxin